MKLYPGIFAVFAVILLAGTAQAAGSGGTISVTSPQDAASLVYVSSVDLDPAVWYPYETGTITVHLTNAANQSIGLSQPDLIDPHVHIVSHDTFSTMTYIGPGATVDYAFLVTVDPPDGTYFPLFTVSTKEGSPVHSTIRVVVDSTDIRASIAKKPDNFAISKKDTVNVSIVNPRDGDVTDVLIVPEGSGVGVTPSESFVGLLKAGTAVQVPFEVTPSPSSSDLRFQVSFRNGNNKHTTDIVLPLTIGEDKTAVIPIINNIEVVSQGLSYHLTGDVNNAGITDARSMVLSIGTPARAVEPYAEYAIGTLASDDFSSFELTFTTTDLSAVPLQIRWKDADGNTFTTVKALDLRTASGVASSGSAATGSSGSVSAASGTSAARTGGAPGGGGIFGFGGSRSGGISAFYPVIAGGVILIAAVALWMKRKWIASRIRKR